MDLIIKNAEIFVEGQIHSGGVAIDKGKIVKVSKEPNLPSGETVIDGKGQLVIPGAIDCHAHLRDLNYSNKEDFYTGTCAAAVGGFTTVMDMPNTSPPTISSELLHQKMKIAQKKIVINTGFYAGIPNSVKELDSLKKSGVFGFKLYLTNSLSQFNIDDLNQLKNLLSSLKKLGMPLLIHAERKNDIEEFLTRKKQLNLSPEDVYLESHSGEVEARAIRFILDLNASIGAEIRICHITTATGIELVKKARKEGQSVSVEVTPHHLFLTSKDLKARGPFAKMLPPLRGPDDVAALWEGLNAGSVDSIATDHAPHTLSEKTCGFSEAANGIPGFETTLPLLFTALNEEKISLSRLVQVIAENPAIFLKLSKKGKIKPGYDADLVILDLHREQKIDAQRFLSKAKFSPFEGRVVKGIPTTTIVNGKVVMQEGQIMVPEGSGIIIKRQLQ